MHRPHCSVRPWFLLALGGFLLDACTQDLPPPYGDTPDAVAGGTSIAGRAHAGGTSGTPSTRDPEAPDSGTGVGPRIGAGGAGGSQGGTPNFGGNSGSFAEGGGLSAGGAGSVGGDEGGGEGGTGAAGGKGGAGSSGGKGGAGSSGSSGGKGGVGSSGGKGGAGSSGGSGAKGGASGAGGSSVGGAFGGHGGSSGAGSGAGGASDGGGTGDGGAAGDGGSGGAASEPRKLYFSEYVEASSSFKALEIFSPAGASLEGCAIRFYFNGNLESSSSLALHGELSPGGVSVLCSTTLGALLPERCARSTKLNFNGDDAIALECDGTLYDVIGQIGVDPGDYWGDAVRTADRTLRRLCSVTLGDTTGEDAFLPELEWQAFPSDTYDDLGVRGCPTP